MVQKSSGRKRYQLRFGRALLLGWFISLCSAGLTTGLTGSSYMGIGSLAWAHQPGNSLAISQTAISQIAVTAQPTGSTAAQRSLVSQVGQSAPQLTPTQLEEQGRARYLDGDFLGAIALWQHLAQSRAAQQNAIVEAGALSNLSLAYQQLGRWTDAQAAIDSSLAMLGEPETPMQQRAQAQVLMAQGSLQMALGHSRQALAIWQQAEAAYRQGGDTTGGDRARINQAQALRELGFYRQALERLTSVIASMAEQPPSPLKATTLRRMGETLRLNGQLADAQTMLTQSLEIAKQYDLPAEVSATLLSLGHTAYSRGDRAAALAFYQQALSSESSSAAQQRVPVQLALLELGVELGVETAQWSTVAALWPEIQAQFASLPPSRTTVYLQVHWAHSLIRIKQANPNASGLSWMTIAQQLQRASQQARELGDMRAEAYAVGTLGRVYEQTQQWAIAQDLTQQALQLSNRLNAAVLTYQWQWQLGRIWQAPDNPQQSVPAALDAYNQAIATLSGLRGDLAAVGDSAQFSFKENVEPIYRQLVRLLLSSDTVSQADLVNAQAVIESLRLAELDDYFKEACADIEPININQVDPRAAIIYSIILKDRLAVILRLPDQPLQYFTTPVSASVVAETAAQLRQQLVIRSRREYFPAAEMVYQWLIGPARTAIDSSGVDTLVFVLDGALQSLPMAALYDGSHFLIEDYGVALAPGLKLLKPQPWDTTNLDVLVAGLTEGRLGRSPLPYVASEIEKITATFERSTVLLNRGFTQKTLPENLESANYPIVHIATHGQFSSIPEETYLIAWDGRITVRELSQILQVNPSDRAAIQLLVLSACETASGDRRAALGLAGVAIKAGARSTVATLWAINDEATAQFAGYFYKQLTQPGATRATALRTAQVQLLKDPQYQHPIYWAPYILLGSWL